MKWIIYFLRNMQRDAVTWDSVYRQHCILPLSCLLKQLTAGWLVSAEPTHLALIYYNTPARAVLTRHTGILNIFRLMPVFILFLRVHMELNPPPHGFLEPITCRNGINSQSNGGIGSDLGKWRAVRSVPIREQDTGQILNGIAFMWGCEEDCCCSLDIRY